MIAALHALPRSSAALVLCYLTDVVRSVARARKAKSHRIPAQSRKAHPAVYGRRPMDTTDAVCGRGAGTTLPHVRRGAVKPENTAVRMLTHIARRPSPASRPRRRRNSGVMQRRPPRRALAAHARAVRSSVLEASAPMSQFPPSRRPPRAVRPDHPQRSLPVRLRQLHDLAEEVSRRLSLRVQLTIGRSSCHWSRRSERRREPRRVGNLRGRRIKQQPGSTVRGRILASARWWSHRRKRC